MLDLKSQRRWVAWPEAKIRFLLSPLTISKRRELYQQATELQDPKTGAPLPAGAKGGKPGVNQQRFQQLVADTCIHGWEGEINTPYSAEAAHALMDIDPANVFIFTTVQGLGIYMASEVQAAGNA
jgi:hypothetical protein